LSTSGYIHNENIRPTGICKDDLWIFVSVKVSNGESVGDLTDITKSLLYECASSVVVVRSIVGIRVPYNEIQIAIQIEIDSG
jgi:hypothetical protein